MTQTSFVRYEVSLVDHVYGQIDLDNELSLYTSSNIQSLRSANPEDYFLISLLEHDGYYHPMTYVKTIIVQDTDIESSEDVFNNRSDLPSNTIALSNELERHKDNFNSLCPEHGGLMDSREQFISYAYDPSERCLDDE